MALPLSGSPADRPTLAEVPPAAEPAALGEAAFRWEHPDGGLAVAAFGEAERRDRKSVV